MAPGVGAAPVASKPLPPAVDPSSVEFIRNFRNQVVTQLENRCGGKGEAMAMSVINRGIGLTNIVTVLGLTPSETSIEQTVYNVFSEAAGRRGPQGRLGLVDARLMEVLKKCKADWTNALKDKLSVEKAEALLLSVIDQTLDFTDKSILASSNDAEKREFELAENLLLTQVAKIVQTHQENMAAVAAANPPAPVPVPAVSRLAPTQPMAAPPRAASALAAQPAPVPAAQAPAVAPRPAAQGLVQATPLQTAPTQIAPIPAAPIPAVPASALSTQAAPAQAASAPQAQSQTAAAPAAPAPAPAPSNGDAK
jgi:hypothetical protein